MSGEPIVRVHGLSVAYRGGGRDVPVVDDVGFEVRPGQTLALVGESGSGKSTIAGTLLGHLRHGSRLTGGTVRVAGNDVFTLGAGELRRLRGGTVALVPQNAGHALTPSMRVGRQIDEAVRGVRGVRQGAARTAVYELLEQVRLPRTAEVARRYPHELSGGQQQRVAIAMAIAARPRVLVLDEPTTGLDVVSQRGILDLLAGLRDELGLATVVVSHHLGVVARMADEVAVLQSGRVVEHASARRLFAAPVAAHTRRLLASVPRIADPGLAVVGEDGAREIRLRDAVPGDAAEVIDVEDLTIDYGATRIVQGVSLRVRRGEVVALVGESGSGKSTLAWALAGLHKPSGGTMRHAGGTLAPSARQRPATLRRKIQLVFQNADASLNPRRSVGDAVRWPLRFFGTAPRAEVAQRARRLIADARLDPALADRLPLQLSGGQRQRIGIARALAGEPDLLIADEITTALDVSVQAEVLQLLDDLCRERQLACVFISHDLAVVRGLAHRVVVLRNGSVVEEGPTEAVFSTPGHPYTRQLMAATLEPDPETALTTADHSAGEEAAGGDGSWADLGGGHRVRRPRGESGTLPRPPRRHPDPGQ